MFTDKKPEEMAELFVSNLLDTNRGFNYYVDWNNINGYQKFLIEIHALDVLIGQKDDQQFEAIFKELLGKLPTTVATFPYLFALAKADRYMVWNSAYKLKIIGTELDDGDFKEYDFSLTTLRGNLTDEQIDLYYDFFKKMGLKNLFQNLLEKSVLDYIIGVLVGLDSNGRKNRGGLAFELACKPILDDICNKYGIKIITQKKFSVLRKYDISVSEDIENRKADFILLDTNSRKCMNIEVNFYNGAGSKPEEIIDSYINRQSELANNNIEFALITDGNCWKGTSNQLVKGFRRLKYLMNFKIAKSGLLEEIITQVFEK